MTALVVVLGLIALAGWIVAMALWQISRCKKLDAVYDASSKEVRALLDQAIETVKQKEAELAKIDQELTRLEEERARQEAVTAKMDSETLASALRDRGY